MNKIFNRYMRSFSNENVPYVWVRCIFIIYFLGWLVENLRT